LTDGRGFPRSKVPTTRLMAFGADERRVLAGSVPRLDALSG
jgi:hypothetical protein